MITKYRTTADLIIESSITHTKEVTENTGILEISDRDESKMMNNMTEKSCTADHPVLSSPETVSISPRSDRNFTIIAVDDNERATAKYSDSRKDMEKS